MKNNRLRIITTIVLLLVATLVVHAAAVTYRHDKSDKTFKFPKLRDIQVPPIQSLTLQSQMKVFLMEDHELPLVRIHVIIRTGNAFDPKEMVGLAVLAMDQIRSGGIPGLDGDALDEKLDNMGATITAGCDDTYAWIQANCLAEDAPAILDLLYQMMRQPQFAADKLDLAKTQLRSAISRRNDDPGAIADREFRKLIYGTDSPYARQMEYEHLDRVTRNDLVYFHEKFFKPQFVSLGIWGDFEPAPTTSILTRTFGQWPGDTTPGQRFPTVVPSPAAGVYLISRPNVTQSEIRLGHLGIEMSNPDYFAVEVMNKIFGTNGFLSRLMKVVRTEEGLTYGINGGIYAEMKYPGMFAVDTFTKSESTVKAIQVIINEINRMRDSLVTEEELETARSAYLNGFVFNFASTYAVLTRIMTLDYYGFPEDFLEQTRQEVAAVSREAIHRVARQYLHPDQLKILVVGKPEDFGTTSLDVFGQVQPVDISIPEPAVVEEAIPEPTPASLARGKIVLNRATEVMKAQDVVSDLQGTHMVEASEIQFNPQMKFMVKVETWTFLPDKIVFRMSSDTIPQLSVTQVVTGGTGWAQSVRGLQNLSPEECTRQVQDIQRSPLVILKNAQIQGFPAQYIGESEVKGKMYDTLYIRQADAAGFKVYFDPETGHLAGMLYRGKRGNEPGNFLALYSDPADFGEIVYPRRNELYFNDELFISSSVEQLAINPAEDSTLFIQPDQQ
ncbi:MAG: insulinase family protein [Acidobacteria bacterium]|nr:insulinase family protein [Acidobacteriota bacterium]